MKIECPWKGCSGIIDISKDISIGFDRKQKVSRVPWLIHTITCPKCKNVVGNFDISPQTWISLRKDGRIKEYIIQNPRTGKSIEFKKNPDLNHHLKKWAVCERKRKKRR
ncbi:MAG: hypothetical protein QMC80_01955 [Thermoplasmatales archaeon]|nr:hypothetical protein [Thermoplasmatales archaeon]